jgi:hypothetical protein
MAMSLKRWWPKFLPNNMKRRHFTTYLAIAGLSLTVPLLAAEPAPKLTALLFYASAGAPPADLSTIKDEAQDLARYEKSLISSFGQQTYSLVGRHSSEASMRYSIWLKPSPQFPLQIENLGRAKNGGLNLFWTLWQKEPLPTKDRELIKSSAVLMSATPLIIGGPRWREGRLIFLVRLDS